MVRIDRLREDSEKRILRCSEGKSIWYQIYQWLRLEVWK